MGATPPRPSAPASQRLARLLRGSSMLAQWVLAGGAAERAPWAWRTQLRWHAHWFSHLSRQQAARIQSVRPLQAPIFVLGFWRSGTTLLHEWLAALPGHAAPATWQCFNPASFMLTGPPAGATTGVVRPMDSGWIAPSSPQEDEFALLLQGAPSVYRGFIDPRRLEELALQVFDANQDDGLWVEPWMRFLAGVEQMAAGLRLVLKSPNHTFRLKRLAQVFPDSPWVWIGRPAVTVWHSNLRMWRSMFDTYGLWSAPPGQLESFLDECMRHYIAMLEWALEALPSDNIMWVDFDELCASPLSTLKRIASNIPKPAGQHWDHDALLELLGAHPVAPSVTDDATVPAALVPRFNAFNKVHAQARAKWGLPR